MKNNFSIYNFRTYNCIPFDHAQKFRQHDLICSGSCDIASIRYSNDIHYWWEYLGGYPIGLASQPLFPLLHSLKHYSSKELFLVLPTPQAQEYILPTGQIFWIFKHSLRVIRFMKIKKLINEYVENEMLEIANNLSSVCIDECIEKIKYIGHKHHSFKWTINPTDSALSFWTEYLDELLDDKFMCDSFVGYSRKLDSMPDSSPGPQSQKAIARLFDDSIK